MGVDQARHDDAIGADRRIVIWSTWPDFGDATVLDDDGLIRLQGLAGIPNCDFRNHPVGTRRHRNLGRQQHPDAERHGEGKHPKNAQRPEANPTNHSAPQRTMANARLPLMFYLSNSDLSARAIVRVTPLWPATGYLSLRVR